MHEARQMRCWHSNPRFLHDFHTLHAAFLYSPGHVNRFLFFILLFALRELFNESKTKTEEVECILKCEPSKSNSFCPWGVDGSLRVMNYMGEREALLCALGCKILVALNFKVMSGKMDSW